MKAETGKNREHKSVHVAGFQVVENECIWMKSGVVNFRLCDNAYDCITCPFDKGMQKAMHPDTENRGRGLSAWAESFRREYRNDDRPCRHVLTGRIDPPKTCPNNYECSHCSFDQWLDEIATGQYSDQNLTYRSASGYRMAGDYYYHAGHAWACFEHGGYIKVGFDDFLVHLFGQPDRIALPDLGAVLQQGESGWEFARDSHQASVLSPVSGTVLAVNHRIAEHPDIISTDPYKNGWLFLLESDMPRKNLKKLYHGTQSVKWMENEAQKLLSLISPEYRGLSATGAQPVSDVYARIPELGWDLLVKTFLRT